MNLDFDPPQAEVFPNPDSLDATPGSDPNSQMVHNRSKSVNAYALVCLIAWAASVPVLADVVINEIHYDAADETSPEEFVELYNTGPGAVDLGGAYFDDGIEFTFPGGTILPAGGFLVVAQDPARLLARYGATALGPYAGALAGGGERLRLRRADSSVLDEVTFSDHFPWPTLAGGGGSSMELLHPGLDNDVGGSWRSSSYPDTVVVEPAVFITPGSSAWRYRKGNSEPPATWRNVGFAMDGTWFTGTTSIGFGDNDDATILSDMSSNYNTVYLRHNVTVTNAAQIVASGVLNLYVDDGAIIWINGVEVARRHVTAGDKTYTAVGENHEAAWETVTIDNLGDYLAVGTNTIAVMVLNAGVTSSDLSIDLELKTADATTLLPVPTPGTTNSVYVPTASDAPPAIRQVDHVPKQPRSGQPVTVTAKVTDPDGVGQVRLLYQVVSPGAYLPAYIAWTPQELLADPFRPPLENPSFEAATNWTEVVMHDDGLAGDALAGDSIFTVVLPSGLQTHRRLVRYRIKAEDGLQSSVRVPYLDDPSLNFAYFCYDGVPAWAGAIQPGAVGAEGQVVSYDTNVMRSLPTYHLISKSNEVDNCQYYNLGWTDDPAVNAYNWQGTMVYDGEVYDHIRYRIRGWSHPYSEGKNKWKFDFNRGRPFQARDDSGRNYPEAWDKVNFISGYSHRFGSYYHAGEESMIVAANCRLYNLLGVPTTWTHFIQFRVIDTSVETSPSSQYEGDFWGLYLVIEQPDGRYLDAHNLPNGNLYKMEGTGGPSLNNQGPTHPTDGSDLSAVNAVLNGTPSAAWFDANTQLDAYFSYRAICYAVHHYDISAQSNHLMYHDPVTGKWWMLPWDSDQSWGALLYANDTERFQKSLIYPQYSIAFKNRAREIRDLLFNATEGSVLINELASYIARPDTARAFVDADRALWDYHPRGKDPGKYFDYESGGTFPGVVARMKTWMGNGWGGTNLDGKSADADIPLTPSINYTGIAGYPINGLSFNCSSFNDPQGSGTFAALQWRAGEVLVTNAPAYDPTEPPPYEIIAKWESGEITNFNANITIPPNALKVGHAYRVRVRMKDNSGRWSHWSPAIQFITTEPESALALATYLRVTEVMYNPTGASDFEFIELRNTSTNQVLDLSGAAFTSGVTFSFPGGTTLAPGGYLLVTPHPDASAFRSHYGISPSIPVAGPYSGKLDNAGEQLTLKTAPGGREISSFNYGSSRHWPLAAAGAGHSLVPKNPDSSGQATGALDYPGNWRASTKINGSPGVVDPVPPAPTVLLNEIAAHTDYNDPSKPEYDSNDWIELYNTTATNINLTGWYLSDDPALPAKWAFPNINIPAHAWTTLTEVLHFHNPITSGFGLNKAGEQVLLSFLPGTSADRVVDAVGFKGQDNNRTLSRFPDGAAFWHAASPTLNGPNSPPLSGLRVTEVMYQPAGGSTNDNIQDEYIEICNPTSGAVTLDDATGPWRLDGGVAYTFPDNTSLPAGGCLLVVSFNPLDTAKSNAFVTTYGITGGLVVLGPYSGKLGNDSDRVALERPQLPDAVGEDYSWIVEDEVVYGNQMPWPTAAAGNGSSLHRHSVTQHGNDPLNWFAAAPSPGVVINDQDGDGMPDEWEQSNGTNPLVWDADVDLDNDDYTNFEEYIAGTGPTNAASFLALWAGRTANGGLGLSFAAVSNRSYTIETGGLSGLWLSWTNISANPSNRLISLTNTVPGTNRYFRLRTPASQ